MIIAMWSGPRNLSTAMMYSFAARDDCAVWDEPFYAAYLAATGIDHPLKEASIAAGDTDPDRVARRCAEASPEASTLFYQKHMTHHMVAGFPLDWMQHCANVFLIRDPRRVLASYLAKRQQPTSDDLGFARQLELFEAASELTGALPPVIDAHDIRANPRRALTRLCDAIGIRFTEKMLSWPAGGRVEDGPWAAHWYGAVHKSTGFQAAEGPLPDIEAGFKDILRQAMPIYEQLREHALAI